MKWLNKHPKVLLLLATLYIIVLVLIAVPQIFIHFKAIGAWGWALIFFIMGVHIYGYGCIIRKRQIDMLTFLLGPGEELDIALKKAGFKKKDPVIRSEKNRKKKSWKK